MDALSTGYSALSDLNLWFKVQSGDPLNLADIPAIIRTRYVFIVANWEDIKTTLLSNSSQYSDPARLVTEIASFSNIVAQALIHKDNVGVLNVGSLLSSYFAVFDALAITDITITPQERIVIKDEVARVNAFTKNSFTIMRQQMVDGRDAIADTIGGTDPDYNRIYERSPLPQLLNKTIKNLVLSNQLETGIDAATAILANQSILNTAAFIDPFAFARANANNPEIDIKTYQSGKLARLNYGETLQTLATRTMQDESRWLEIAIANGLKPPYVDEIGIELFLATNAQGNKINVPKTDTFGNANKDRFYINQIVILRSNTQQALDQRNVVGVREIPVSGELVIELSGAADLDRYKTVDRASVRVFLKNTINSNFYILIPSNDPAPATSDQDTPWFLQNKAEDERNAGVDFLLSDTGDLQFTASGDLTLSYGVANALQAVKILLATQQGDLFAHPDYGIIAKIGDKNTDVDSVKADLTNSISQQILNDPRFQRLDYITVEYLSSGGVSGYSIRLGVVLAGGGTSVVPITFSVNVA